MAEFSRACRKAYVDCRFRFATEELLPKFRLTGLNDRAFTPRMISKTKGEHLGLINTIGIRPEIVLPRAFVTIDMLQSPKMFTSSHLKPFPLHGNKWSGIAFEYLTYEQKEILKGKCVRVHFTNYQVLNADGKVQTNANHLWKSDRACVVFKLY